MKTKNPGKLLFLVAAFLTLLLSKAKADLYISGSAGYISHCRITWSYHQYGTYGDFTDYNEFEATVGPDDTLWYPEEFTSGGNGDVWWESQTYYSGYVYWLEPIPEEGGENSGGGGGGGGGGVGGPGLSFTAENRAVEVGGLLDFHVWANNNAGLTHIGLESCDPSGTPVENRGEILVNGTAADNIFTVDFNTPGTYYFDCYYWNANHQLVRSPVMTVDVDVPAPTAVSSALDQYLEKTQWMTSTGQWAWQGSGGVDFGMNDYQQLWQNEPSKKNGDKILLEAVNRGIINAKTNVVGPLTRAQANTINERMGRGDKIAGAIVGVISGTFTAVFYGPVGGVVAGSAIASQGNPNQRHRFVEGDIVITTYSIIYAGPNSHWMVGDNIDMRVINQNLPYQNQTGITVFTGNENTQLLYEVSSEQDDVPGQGIRLYMDNGIIKFQVIPPPNNP